MQRPKRKQALFCDFINDFKGAFYIAWYVHSALFECFLANVHRAFWMLKLIS